MNSFASFVIKETRHILRDRRTVMILFGMPVVMMLLFGFAISTDLRNVRVAVVTSQLDVQTQRVVDRLGASEYFTIVCRVSTPSEAERLIRRQQADMAVVFAPGYADNAHRGTAEVQLVTDGTDPNTARMQAGYARQIICGGAPVKTKMLYNPQMRSSYNFVPGIMGLLLMLICALMTSVSIVREKERGTMEVLLVSPVRPLMIIVSKAVPYLVLSLVILVCILLLSAFVLDVPVAGSLMWIFAVSLVYILLALSLGLLISVIARTQLEALLLSAMVLLMPTLLLSGLVYPIESMPAILQYVSCIVPARWYISAMRKLLIMGVGVSAVVRETAVLGGMAVLLLTLALRKFKTGLQ